MVNQCSVVTELLCAHLGSQLYPRLNQKWSRWAQCPAWLNCQTAHSLGQTGRRAGCEPPALHPRKKSPLFEISLALFPCRANFFFSFFFSGKFYQTPLVFLRATVLWNVSEHFPFLSLSQLKHPLQLLSCVVCLSKARIIRILTS